MANVALITGITGQDGSFLAEFLLEKGYEVHGIIRRSSSFNTGRIEHLYLEDAIEDMHKNRKVILHYGDMTDSESMIRIIREVEPDEIYNLAAQSHVQVSFEVPEFNPIELKSERKISTWLGNPSNPSMAVCTGSMIKLTGTPVISGNYINLEIDNVTSKTGSLVYPTSEFSAIIDKAVKEKKKVTVEGYSLYLSGSDKYINMIVTGVTII